DRVSAQAGAGLARVTPGALVTVVAEAPVGLGGIRAGAGVRVARPGLVTLIRGGAEDRGTPLAGAVLAGVGPRAGVPVVAERAITLGGALALRGGLGADGAVACVEERRTRPPCRCRPRCRRRHRRTPHRPSSRGSCTSR